MGFNSEFKGLKINLFSIKYQEPYSTWTIWYLPCEQYQIYLSF